MKHKPVLIAVGVVTVMGLTFSSLPSQAATTESAMAVATVSSSSDASSGPYALPAVAIAAAKAAAAGARAATRTPAIRQVVSNVLRQASIPQGLSLFASSQAVASHYDVRSADVIFDR